MQGQYSRRGLISVGSRGVEAAPKGTWVTGGGSSGGVGGGGIGVYRSGVCKPDFGGGLDLLAAVAPSSPGGCITGELFDQVDQQDVHREDQEHEVEEDDGEAGADRGEGIEGGQVGSRGRQWHTSSSIPPAAGGSHDFDVDEASR
jgi:hypothetical protein